MRGALKITTVSADGGGYEVEQEGKVASWLKQFAKSIDQQDTVVQQARRRQTQGAGYLDNVRNILVNRPRYATVEDAVKDFRKRTGLDSYLAEIKQADHKTGLKKEATSSIKSRIALRMASLDKLGLKKKVKQAAEAKQIPQLLAQYSDAVGDIETFIKNRIEDLHAMGVTVPQLQQSLLENFSIRHGVRNKDVYNNEVAQWLSDKIEEAQALVSVDTGTPQLGAGVYRDNDSNEDSDAFAGLMPTTQN